MGLSGMTYIKAICRALECKPKALYILDCPVCHEPDKMELDPGASAYWCGSCGCWGSLKDLATLAEGIFFERHRETRSLMESRPGVKRGGGKR